MLKTLLLQKKKNRFKMFTPTIHDPDKFGMLIEIKQKMDELNSHQFRSFGNSLFDFLSREQLKTMLFVGLNTIKNDIQYDQLFKIKTTVNQLHSGEEPSDAADALAVIPDVIISTRVCNYLNLSSIIKFGMCSRRFLIISRTPYSLNSSQFRYTNPYRYCITEQAYCLDRDIFTQDDIHLFSNVEHLSIVLPLRLYTRQNRFEKLRNFENVKHLTFYDYFDEEFYETYSSQNSLRNKELDWPKMQSLQSICFECQWDFRFLLSFLNTYRTQLYKNHIFGIKDSSNYFRKAINNLKSISFINCNFYSIDFYADFHGEDAVYGYYQNMLHFLLQSTPNKLNVVKFEGSAFRKTVHVECNEINEEFENIDRIKLSLCNIKGIVYSLPSEKWDDWLKSNDHFYQLTQNLLNNISSFKNLQSIHTHCKELTSSYLHSNNITALKNISEICTTLEITSGYGALMGNIKRLVQHGNVHINKVCLVINLSWVKYAESNIYFKQFIKLIKTILMCKSLVLFQIVLKAE
eukprot:526250_1